MAVHQAKIYYSDNIGLLATKVIHVEDHGVDPDVFHTVEEYWDCECGEDYIQSKKKAHCETCNTHREDQPDSRLDELAGTLSPCIIVRTADRKVIASNG